ncbi:MAG: amidohydrolase family protein, partial [Lachnospiraceae bacterium]|nr:amidohydrolase family protein [Lachnospiraceae bacterium]
MIALTNCKAVTVTNGTIENAVILVEDGVLKAVGANVEIPADAEVIDLEGKWVTPGFIDAHSHFSAMSEPRARGGGDDGNEITNPVTAHI